MKTSGIILAGGHSTRMGRDKTLMTVDADTLIGRTVKELGKVVDEVIIASNRPDKYNLPGTIEVPDLFVDIGPLGGIHAGLLAARNQYSFVVAGDMPLFTADLVTCLRERIDESFKVIVPEIEDFLQPLCAVYAKACIEDIEQFLAMGFRSVNSFCQSVRSLIISEKELTEAGLERIKDIFYNVNTPDDYNKLLGHHHS